MASMPKAVLADDLTGAMDTGIQAARNGHRVSVLLNSDHARCVMSSCDTVVLDTESRNIGKQEAYERVRRAVELLSTHDTEIVYKKIDSTCRGNIGAEIDALLDARVADMIVLAPALPHKLRVTVEGIHYVSGERLEDTEIARDPLYPVFYSRISDIVNQQSERRVWPAHLPMVTKGADPLRRWLETGLDKGYSIAVADVVDNSHLLSCATAIYGASGHMLGSGSAGLFEAMHSYASGTKHSFAQTPVSDKPVLIVCGSPSGVSRNQIEYALSNDARIGSLEVFSACVRAESVGVQPLIDKACELLASGVSVVIDGAPIKREALLKQYQANLPEMRRISTALLEGLGHVVRDIVSSTEISGLVLVGGDTAVAACSALGAHSIDVNLEVRPYVPSGILSGGVASGMRVVTKAGGFGDKDVLLSCVRFLKGVTDQKLAGGVLPHG